MLHAVAARPVDLDLRAVGVRDHAHVRSPASLFRVLPAWRASRVDPIDALKQQSRSCGSRRRVVARRAGVDTDRARRRPARGRGIAAAQLRQVEPGRSRLSDPTAWSCSTCNMPPRYGKGGASLAFMREVEQRVESQLGMPATIVSGVAGQERRLSASTSRPEAEGCAPPAPIDLSCRSRRVSADFFDVSRYSDARRPHVHAGRWRRRDHRERRPGAPLLRQHCRRLGAASRPIPAQPWLTVVGVAADVKTMGPADADRRRHGVLCADRRAGELQAS